MKHIRGTKFVCQLCCDKADWRLFQGFIVVACPDHPPVFIEPPK
jgi:hypothetical protein